MGNGLLRRPWGHVGFGQRDNGTQASTQAAGGIGHVVILQLRERSPGFHQIRNSRHANKVGLRIQPANSSCVVSRETNHSSRSQVPRPPRPSPLPGSKAQQVAKQTWDVCNAKVPNHMSICPSIHARRAVPGRNPRICSASHTSAYALPQVPPKVQAAKVEGTYLADVAATLPPTFPPHRSVRTQIAVSGQSLFHVKQASGNHRKRELELSGFLWGGCFRVRRGRALE